MSERIQLKRTKGWRMPPNTVKVDRTSLFGNPYRVGLYRNFTAEDAVSAFREWLPAHPYFVAMVRRDLAGKNLACWCKPGAPCHADVLLELANQSHEQGGDK